MLDVIPSDVDDKHRICGRCKQGTPVPSTCMHVGASAHVDENRKTSCNNLLVRPTRCSNVRLRSRFRVDAVAPAAAADVEE